MFIFPPSYFALCASKAPHRFGSEKVSWCLETSLFLRVPSRDETPSLPLLSLSLFFFSFISVYFKICLVGDLKLLFLVKFYFIFKLYIIVLVLPNIKMNPPQVYMCSPS